jgi:hypothetical protein
MVLLPSKQAVGSRAQELTFSSRNLSNLTERPNSKMMFVGIADWDLNLCTAMEGTE